MTPNRLGLLALTLCLGISGCTSVVNASREKPIEDDRGTRTFGSKIDDSLIETKVGVNIAKADPDLDNNSHIVVTSTTGPGRRWPRPASAWPATSPRAAASTTPAGRWESRNRWNPRHPPLVPRPDRPHPPTAFSGSPALRHARCGASSRWLATRWR